MISTPGCGKLWQGLKNGMELADDSLDGRWNGGCGGGAVRAI